MQRRTISSGAPWEKQAAYSRAVRVGPYIVVAGTTASLPDGSITAPGDAYGQSMAVFAKIQAALEDAGAGLRDVVRTRMFVRFIADFPAVARAHSEYFQDIRPAATLVEVSAFVHPDMLVEIEADAICADEPPE